MKPRFDGSDGILLADCEGEIQFIFEGHQILLNDLEMAAYKRLVFEQKARSSGARMAAMIRSKWISDDPEVRTLLSGGPEAFYNGVRDRIFEAERRKDLVLNRCPKCRALTRTATACLCPACNHTWYEKRNRLAS